MNPLFRGISEGRAAGPTLKSVRRMRNLTAALHEISRRPVGIDQIPFEAFRDPLGYMRWNPKLLDAYPDRNPLKTLQESLVECPIPDASQAFRIGKRNLERGTVANKIVERALTRKLNSNLDRYFSDRSFAFRPGKSPEMAILEVRKAIRYDCHWAAKFDFENFFGSIDLGVLENHLRAAIKDQVLVNAILTVTSPAIVFQNKTLQRQNALPQGNGVSPFLSNLYLHPLDEACSHLNYFRYADDMLVLGKSWAEVIAARRLIRGLARILGLRLNENKTFIRDLYRQPLVFLGYELRGGNIYPSEEAIHRLQKNLEFRGIGDREALMMGFVHRYRIGPVRPLFRRVDRQLHRLYPPHMSLVSLLEFSRQRGQGRRQLRRSHGQGCGIPDEKAVSGSPPRPAQPGATPPFRDVAPAPREMQKRPECQ